MSRSSEPDDPRLRFGMDPPRLEERAHWEELIPGADEYVVPWQMLALNGGLHCTPPAHPNNTCFRERDGSCRSCGFEPWTVDEDGEA